MHVVNMLDHLPDRHNWPYCLECGRRVERVSAEIGMEFSAMLLTAFCHGDMAVRIIAPNLQSKGVPQYNARILVFGNKFQIKNSGDER